jgi:hypothetical protein
MMTVPNSIKSRALFTTPQDMTTIDVAMMSLPHHLFTFP